MLPGLLIGLVAGALVALAAVRARRATAGDNGLTVEELELLRRAEQALASADDRASAARELGKHAMALVDAPAAMVLLEDVGGTTRVEVGDTRGHSPYGPGSSAQLLDDAGTPVGTLAVAPPEGGRFDARAERVLTALAERFSSTIHRRSLFDAVVAEQRTLADVVGSSSDGIWSVGPDGRVRSWNPAMERITGITAVVAMGEPCCASFRPSDEAGAPLHGAACPCRTGEQVEVMARLEPAGDTTRWLSCSYSPMSDGGCVVVVRDETARKQVEDEKADFLATVSHELRTPLTPLKGFLQTLASRGDEIAPEDRAHIYEVMLREEGRLERLVDQLLQATVLDHPGSAAAARIVDWAELVEREVASARRQDPSRELELAIAGPLPSVVADDGLAVQAVANLLSNAAKYSPAGSPVTVTVTSDGDRVVTTVADRGPGVAPADRERIFDKFTRLGSHLTRPQQGVGLGLYIVRRSVEAMGGTVWVEEADGGGAAFSFSVPVATLAAEAAPPVPTPASRGRLQARTAR